jgi:8-oxo-dGTP diphosphatase
VLRRSEKTPLIGVVRLRKRNEWVLPKGKLDDGETPRAAAEREVLEETGHDVSVHEFLGTLVYESGGRFKVVHYWRMETNGEQAYELMNDVRAVDWLPLEAAVERLSRGYERAFLANVGPLALEAAALARPSRRPRPKPAVSEKRRSRPAVTPPASLPPPADLTPMMTGLVERPDVVSDAGGAEPSVPAVEFATAEPSLNAEFTPPPARPEPRNDDAVRADRGQRRNLVQKVRDWLRRAA